MLRLSDEDYKYVFSKTPRLCVDLVIKKKDRLLLSKRLIEPYKNLWHFPGGRVGYKESVFEALQRVAMAEIGTSVRVQSLLGYIDFIDDGPYVHSVSLAFQVEANSDILLGSNQAKEFEAFSEIPEDMHPVQKDFLTSLKLPWLKIEK